MAGPGTTRPEGRGHTQGDKAPSATCPAPGAERSPCSQAVTRTRRCSPGAARSSPAPICSRQKWERRTFFSLLAASVLPLHIHSGFRSQRQVFSMLTLCHGWENSSSPPSSTALHGAMHHEAVPARKTSEGRKLQIPQGLPRRISSHHTDFSELASGKKNFSKLILVSGWPTAPPCR